MALFRSRYTNFQQKVRSAVPHYNHLGIEIRRDPSLRAEFGILGEEITVVDPETGQPTMIADIHGGFFDSLAAKEQNNWTDDEHDSVVHVLRQTCRTRPDLCEEVLPVHVPAERPWITYDTTDYKVIVDVAKATGCIGDAIRYEKENLNRAAVLADLMAALNELPDEQGIEELAKSEPREEIPAEKLRPMESGVGTLHVGNPKKDPKTNSDGAVLSTPGLTLRNPATITLD